MRTLRLADRGYDADWIRELARQQGAWANVPPKRTRKDAICFSPYLYRARNLIERFFNKIKQCRRVEPDMTNSQPTIWRSPCAIVETSHTMRRLILLRHRAATLIDLPGFLFATKPVGISGALASLLPPWECLARN
jgi:transposase